MTKSNLRFDAVNAVLDRQIDSSSHLPEGKVTDYFGSNVFDLDKMKDFLSDDVYDDVEIAIKTGKKIDRSIADHVAAAMKAWAMGRGASHYTHWFQPLTGATAEKHDSFFTLSKGKSVESFGGGELVQQEPDASSFPSGGLRSTFEARGYTAWDPTSPAFIMEQSGGKTLCIPTIFVSYTGEALDYKAPLLKSLNAIEESALGVMHYFDKNVVRVTGTLGWEQEYFVVDEALYTARPDLQLTGRTLFGNAPAKGQQLDDHYFGAIPERTYNFMRDFETEAHKLGIPVTTRHNEVAPAQFECAPIFEEINIAVDHNQLLQDVMERVARRHKLRVLLHEKPYAGINGSGKHNNWSLGTDTGTNLLSPGKTPKQNLRFLTFFINTIKACHDNADLLRSAIATAGNDFRLGANEAPPAIFSVFIGTLLESVLEKVRNGVESHMDLSEEFKAEFKIDIHNAIPDLMKDNTDRNRTSPFAFTGNKFEFRAVGSTANCAHPMIVMNTIVANQLNEFKTNVDARIKNGEKKDGAILRELTECIKSSKDILFGGDGYGDEWVKEATDRGLKNVKDTARALNFFKEQRFINLFEKTGVYTSREIHARHEISLENYIMKVQIESKIAEELALTHVVPAAIKYQGELAQNIANMSSIGVKDAASKTKIELVEAISKHINIVVAGTETLIDNSAKAAKEKNIEKQAVMYCDNVRAQMEAIRSSVDALETLIDDKSWPLPKYRELLFVR